MESRKKDDQIQSDPLKIHQIGHKINRVTILTPMMAGSSLPSLDTMSTVSRARHEQKDSDVPLD